MLRRLLRSALLGAAVTAAVSLPSTASAQALYFTNCGTPGVCGWVEAFFTGSLLTLRVSNTDNTLGSALYSAQLIFDGALNAGSPGSAFQASTTAETFGNVTSIGTTSPSGWFASGVGDSNVLDVASFFNQYIEGNAVSSSRAAPGDPDAGTWVNHGGGYVEFTSDLTGVTGIDGKIVGLGFCTDQDCVSGDAVLATPEPATLTLFATGLIGIAVIRRRRKSV